MLLGGLTDAEVGLQYDRSVAQLTLRLISMEIPLQGRIRATRVMFESCQPHEEKKEEERKKAGETK